MSLERNNLAAAFAQLLKVGDDEWVVSEPREKKVGRKPGFKMPVKHGLGADATQPLDAKTRMRNMRSRKAQERCENIAILDMETDPFDDTLELKISPFLAVLYSDKFDTIVIWEQDHEIFAEKVIRAVEELPGAFTIFAHNGGRFDFLFLMHKLRGAVAFKGRGIMSAKVGRHELRDSFHIIPERLANWQKDKFDYSKLKKGTRQKHREEIIKYCISDCRYLLDIVKKFVDGFGLKLTIAQAAKHEMRKHYEIPSLHENFDGYLRQFFFGGRVECLRGRGEFTGHYKLFDVNSLYPDVMARFEHPIGAETDYEIRYGVPGPATVFIDLDAQNNGALICKGADGETTAQIKSGRFRTTIWEYEVACKYNLISNVKINFCIDCSKRSNFSKFVLPLYNNRLTTKSELDRMKQAGQETGAAYLDMKKDDIFYKLLLNNGYGYWAINPRRFKEHFLTDPDETPPDEWFRSINKIEDENERAKHLIPAFESDRYWIWQKPNPGFRFNNVGVAASITGAARSVLLEALQHAVEPIYCDTDSIICLDLAGVEKGKTALGAWDLEDEFSKVIINGKKLYSTWHLKEKKRTQEQIADGFDPRYTVKSKGVSRVTWEEMDCLLHGMQLGTRNRAPTLDRYGEQKYVKRIIRATAPILNGLDT